MLITTLTQLRKFKACETGIRTLIDSLHANHSDTDPISLVHILESNGLDHAIWALRTQHKKYSVLFAIGCAENVLKYFEDKYPDDKRPREAIEAAKNCKVDPTNAAYAARSAAYAARSDAYAAYAARSAAYAARSAADAAYADAADAARSAADAARSAADAADYYGEVAFQKELFLRIVGEA